MKTGKYTAPLDVRFDEVTEKWEVLNDFYFIRPNGDRILVPKGFKSDLKSGGNIPMFPVSDEYNQACVVHDYLYSGEIVTRSLADIIFKEALRALKGMTTWKIPVMYWAVRLFGWMTYKEHTERSIESARHLGGIHETKKKPLWTDGKVHFD